MDPLNAKLYTISETIKTQECEACEGSEISQYFFLLIKDSKKRINCGALINILFIAYLI